MYTFFLGPLTIANSEWDRPCDLCHVRSIVAGGANGDSANPAHCGARGGICSIRGEDQEEGGGLVWASEKCTTPHGIPPFDLRGGTARCCRTELSGDMGLFHRDLYSEKIRTCVCLSLIERSTIYEDN